MFRFENGEAFIDGVPVKPLVEKAKFYGWVKGPEPESPEQRARLRALYESIPDDPEPVELPPSRPSFDPPSE